MNEGLAGSVDGKRKLLRVNILQIFADCLIDCFASMRKTARYNDFGVGPKDAFPRSYKYVVHDV
jgi:hypothetical protein